MQLSQLLRLLAQTATEWYRDETPRFAAGLAYYTLLSLTPLLVLAIAMAATVFGEEAARGQIAAQLRLIVGSEAAEALEAVVMNARRLDAGLLNTLIGVAVLLAGASGVFGQLQAAMNRIWEVAPRAGRGLWGTVRDRLFSFAMVMSVAFLLLVSLILSATLAAVGRFFASSLPGGETLWQIANFAISFAVVSGLFALLFKYVPDAEIAWRDVWVGAVATAALFDLGKLGIGLYLGKSGVSSAYGAAGSVVLMVIWVYYSSLILFLGAEFTVIWARRSGSAIRPSANAISIANEVHRA